MTENLVRSLTIRNSYLTTLDHLRVVKEEIELLKKEFRFTGDGADDAADARYLLYLIEDRERTERTLCRFRFLWMEHVNTVSKEILSGI